MQTSTFVDTKLLNGICPIRTRYSFTAGHCHTVHTSMEEWSHWKGSAAQNSWAVRMCFGRRETEYVYRTVHVWAQKDRTNISILRPIISFYVRLSLLWKSWKYFSSQLPVDFHRIWSHFLNSDMSKLWLAQMTVVFVLFKQTLHMHYYIKSTLQTKGVQIVTL